jgi:hypothetical protein
MPWKSWQIDGSGGAGEIWQFGREKWYFRKLMGNFNL